MKLILDMWSPKQYAEILLSSLVKNPIGVVEGKGGLDHDDFVLQLDGYVEIYEVSNVVIAPSIKGPVIGTGYEIGRVRVYRNYPHEPDEADFVPEATWPRLQDAIIEAIKMVLMDELDRAVEGVSDAAHIMEQREEE